MTKKAMREHLAEHLAAVHRKLSAENAKAKPHPDLVKGYCADIEKTQSLLDANGPDLDKPHGLNWDAVD